MIVSPRKLVLLFATIAFCLDGCDSQVSLHDAPNREESLRNNDSESRRTEVVLRGHAMGTSWRVILSCRATPYDESGLQRQLTTTLEELESQMSHWRDDSTVSRFNQSNSTGPFEITAEIAAVIKEAQRTHELTCGAFDVTSAPLINLWGFGPPGRQQRTPTSEQIEDALDRVDTAHLQLSEPTANTYFLRKQIPNVQIDLSALAKGYAIDVIAENLDASGFDSYLIELGGELRARGANSDGNAWQIGLEQPNAQALRRVRCSVALQDMAIATSGSYRNFVSDAESGTRFSHIIDPRTGHPVSNDLVSVSVIDSSAMRADAWATALMVLGSEEGYQLAEELELAATFLSDSTHGLTERSTRPFSSAYTGFAPAF